jgi:hypothetical protein
MNDLRETELLFSNRDLHMRIVTIHSRQMQSACSCAVRIMVTLFNSTFYMNL